MKKLLLSVLGVLLAIVALQAQQYDVLDQVRADVRKSRGMEGPHRFDHPGSLTPAPRGYRPFYISHYGRHGSRYAWNSNTYIIVHDALEKAAERAVLTPYGIEFRQKYEDFYLEPWINSGDLVPLGFEQHQRIGTFVYEAFPKVFGKNRKVFAISSTAQRCIVSMGAFNLGLKSGNPRLDIRLRSTHDGMGIVAPPSVHKELRRYFKGENDEVAMESSAAFKARIAPDDAMLARLFTDTAFLDELPGGREKFSSELWQLYCGYHNYEARPLFDDLITDDERVRFWEADNYYSFRSDLTARYRVIPLLEDMLAKADSAFVDPTRAADLRFGHDYILEALVCLLNVNGEGTVPATPEEVKYWFRNFDIPMAATLLFVFYRDRKGDVLFKVLLNEHEARLPDIKPVSGPYYRWSDFFAWAKELLEAHPEIRE